MCKEIGNSGGPLIDKSVGVMGINTFILKESEGLNFAKQAKLPSVLYKICSRKLK